MHSEFRVLDIPVEPLDDGAGEDALPPVGQGVLGEAGRPPVTLLATPQVSVVQLATALWHLNCRFSPLHEMLHTFREKSEEIVTFH